MLKFEFRPQFAKIDTTDVYKAALEAHDVAERAFNALMDCKEPYEADVTATDLGIMVTLTDFITRNAREAAQQWAYGLRPQLTRFAGDIGENFLRAFVAGDLSRCFLSDRELAEGK